MATERKFGSMGSVNKMVTFKRGNRTCVGLVTECVYEYGQEPTITVTTPRGRSVTMPQSDASLATERQTDRWHMTCHRAWHRETVMLCRAIAVDNAEPMRRDSKAMRRKPDNLSRFCTNANYPRRYYRR